tara:strand:- start:614 stop:802 length:189 start_codon:yes stop_codon:yes gene_type:complete
MQTLNQLIKESVEKNDIKTLESVESDLSEVIEFTRKRTINLMFYKQAVANRILVQTAIFEIL